MASGPRTAAEAGLWVDQSGAAAATVTGRAMAAGQQSWAGFTSWYDTAAVAAQAAEMAQLSKSGQETVTGLFAEYLAHVTATIRDTTRIHVPKVKAKPVRGGISPAVVHSRPAQVFKDTFALTGDDQRAAELAVQRAIRLIEDDIMLAARQAQQDAMDELKIGRYRRVLRPELSKGGSCGLCVVASNQIYHRRLLMPIHGRCNCETMPIEGDAGGDGDPGTAINREDLNRIYDAAGSTAAEDLKRTRVQVSEHGELGPVLHVRGQNFTGPGDLGQPPDPLVRKRRLAALEGILAQLEQADKAGQDVNDQLAYQHSAIDRLSA